MTASGEERAAKTRKNHTDSCLCEMSELAVSSTMAVTVSPIVGVIDPPRSQTAIQTGLWYALRTRTRHEKMTARHLEGRGIRTFLPTVMKTRVWTDRTKEVSFVLFPGYVFCQFERRDFPLIRATPGVLYVAPVAAQPMAIPQTEIDNLRTAVERGVSLEPADRLDVGSPVEVIRGPLRGILGRLVEKGRHSRLVIAIDLLQQGVETEIHMEDVVLLRS